MSFDWNRGRWLAAMAGAAGTRSPEDLLRGVAVTVHDVTLADGVTVIGYVAEYVRPEGRRFGALSLRHSLIANDPAQRAVDEGWDEGSGLYRTQSDAAAAVRRHDESGQRRERGNALSAIGRVLSSSVTRTEESARQHNDRDVTAVHQSDTAAAVLNVLTRLGWTPPPPVVSTEPLLDTKAGNLPPTSSWWHSLAAQLRAAAIAVELALDDDERTRLRDALLDEWPPAFSDYPTCALIAAAVADSPFDWLDPALHGEVNFNRQWAEFADTHLSGQPDSDIAGWRLVATLIAAFLAGRTPDGSDVLDIARRAADVGRQRNDECAALFAVYRRFTERQPFVLPESPPSALAAVLGASAPAAARSLQRRSAVVAITVDGDDFDMLCTNGMRWGPDWQSQASRFRVIPYRDEPVYWDWAMSYWVQQWCDVMVLRAYLDTLGELYQIVSDESISSVEHNEPQFVVLTNYLSPGRGQSLYETPTHDG